MADPVSMMMIASTVVSAGGAVMQGRAAEKSANFQAAQMEQNAGQARAAAQREAAEQRRQARLTQSRLQALAGGGGGDVSVVKLAADIAGEGELRALTSLYEGEESALGMETAAGARRFEGKQAKRAANLSAFGTVLGDANKLHRKYS